MNAALHIRLPDAMLVAVRRIAVAQGLGPSETVRQLLGEALRARARAAVPEREPERAREET